jgi:hypothetical protein
MKNFGPHTGADWRYKKGCRCDECRKAHAKYETKRRALEDKEKAGILVRPQHTINAKEVRNHILFLYSHNMGARSIEAKTGISRQTIHYISNGQRKLCTKKVADKVLAIGVKDFHPHRLFDGSQAKQLVDEMRAKGYRKWEIGTMLGYKGGKFNIYKKMQSHNYKKIVELHSKLCPKDNNT